MSRLSDEQLLGQLRALCNREQSTTLGILLHLGEVERRELHLSLGYGSLFDFATRHLRYSESAAGRRIQASRCIRRCPELAQLLRRKEVTLSTIGLVSRVLNGTNKTTLIARVRNKSQREVEAIVAEFGETKRVRDRIHTVQVEVARAAAPLLVVRGGSPGAGMGEPNNRDSTDAANAGDSDERGPFETDAKKGPSSVAAGNDTPRQASQHSRSGSDLVQSTVRDGRNVEQRIVVHFSARPEFKRKLEEARELLSGRFPRGVRLEMVFEAALDLFLERHSPERRHARRRARAERRVGAQRRRGHKAREQLEQLEKAEKADQEERCIPFKDDETRAENEGSSSAPEPSARRPITAAVRDAVHDRDAGRCTYVGVHGVRCDSRHDLEIDHKIPVAQGGGNESENLRLLCSSHNRLEAERVFGTQWMQRFARRA